MADDEAAARPQDVGRSHKRRGQPSPESLALLARYRRALRDELGETLAELRPTAPDGLGLVPAAKPELTRRLRLWDLALKLARELGADTDEPAPTAPTDPAATRGAAPRLTRRDKARLG